MAGRLHPCLTAIHAALMRWLLELPIRQGEARRRLLSALRGVHAARAALWHRSEGADGGGGGGGGGGGADANGSSLADGVELQAFLVGWRALHKRLSMLPRVPVALPLPPALQRACDRLSRAARFDATRFAAVLWKHGGHPAAPRSAEQLSAQTALRQLSAPLQLPADCVGSALLREQPDHPALWAGPEVRQELLSGACTLESIGQLQVTAAGRREWRRRRMVELATAEDEDAAAARGRERLAAIPRAIELRLQTQQQRMRRTGDGEGGGSGANAGGAEAASARPPKQARIAAALWPLQDARSAGHDLAPFASGAAGLGTDLGARCRGGCRRRPSRHRRPGWRR